MSTGLRRAFNTGNLQSKTSAEGGARAWGGKQGPGLGGVMAVGGAGAEPLVQQAVGGQDSAGAGSHSGSSWVAGERTR